MLSGKVESHRLSRKRAGLDGGVQLTDTAHTTVRRLWFEDPIDEQFESASIGVEKKTKSFGIIVFRIAYAASSLTEVNLAQVGQ